MRVSGVVLPLFTEAILKLRNSRKFKSEALADFALPANVRSQEIMIFQGRFARGTSSSDYVPRAFRPFFMPSSLPASTAYHKSNALQFEYLPGLALRVFFMA